MAKQQSSRRPSGFGRGGLGGRRIEKATDVRGSLVRLARYLRPFAGVLSVVVLLVFVATGLAVIGPYLIGQAIDRFIIVGDTAGLGGIVLLMVGMYVGLWLTDTVQNYLMAGVAQKALRNLRRDLFEHLQTLSLGFFDRNPRGELMSRLTNDIDAINRAVSENLTQMVSGMLTLVGIMVAMFLVNGWLALGTLTIIPLMIWLVGFVGKRTRRGFRKLQSELGRLNGIMEETFSGQREVVAFGQQKAALAEFDGVNANVREYGVKAMIYPMLIPPMMGILSNANIAVLAGLGGYLTLRGLASIGTIATFISYSRQFAGPLRQLGDLYNNIQAALAGAERVFEVIDEVPELQDTPDAVDLVDIAGEVIFDEVGFSYCPTCT